MSDLPDPRTVAAFWGLCGGMFYGALGVIAAFSAKVGTPEARRRAVLELIASTIFAPAAAEAFTGVVLAVIPGLAMPAVALTIGLLTVPYAPSFINKVKAFLDKRLGGREP